MDIILFLFNRPLFIIRQVQTNRVLVSLCLCASVAFSAAQAQDYHKDQFDQLERDLDRELERAEHERESRWVRDFSSIENYKASIAPHRRRLIEAIGGLPWQGNGLHPRRVRVKETDRYSVDRVWVSLVSGIDVYGILLTPWGSASKPAPAVVCIHGMGSSPEQVCGLSQQEDYTRRFGARAAERGYVVFAPLMTNQVQTKSRLDRKAILLGTRLQGLEESKILRAIDFLESLPDVDRRRIGIYGISWGGRTAMYAAAIDERIAAAVISGHFNQTVPKMVTPSPHYTAYIETAEDYAFFSGIAKEFSDSDIASMIAPRAVFIEQGTQDRVVYYPMAQAEFERLKKIYDRLGVGTKLEFGLFEGGHVVHGDAAFNFLDKWLKELFK